MKRILSIVLTLAMVLSLFSGITITASAEGDEWIATALADITASDVVVITYTTSGGVTYAMSNDKGTGAAPTAVAVTVTDGKITSTVSDNIKWNISNNNGTLTIYPKGSTTTWLYCINNNNGIRVGTSSNNTFEIRDDYLYNIGQGRYLGAYNAQDFRCYTTINNNIKDETLTFYVLHSASGPCEHDWDEGVVTVQPTCTASGLMTYTCELCGEQRTEAINPLGHNFVDGFCTRCGAVQPMQVYKTSEVHNGDYIAIYHPTSGTLMGVDAVGTKLAPVEVTAPSNDQMLPPDNAAIMEVVFEANEETNFHLKRGDLYLTSPPTGNGLSFAAAPGADETDYGLWYLDNESVEGYTILRNVNAAYNGKQQALEYYSGAFTAYSVGTNAAYQMEIYSDVAPCTHPNPVTTTVPATCTQDGSETVTCPDCGEVLSQTVLPALGHIDENNDGYCDRCGVEIPADIVTLYFINETGSTTLKLYTFGETNNGWPGVAMEQFGVDFEDKTVYSATVNRGLYPNIIVTNKNEGSSQTADFALPTSGSAFAYYLNSSWELWGADDVYLQNTGVYTEPTCTQDGFTTYTGTMDPTKTKVVTNEGSQLGHDWGEPTYSWAADHSTCTAHAVCSRDSSHTLHEVAQGDAVTSVTNEEGTTYTATFENSYFETQTDFVAAVVIGDVIFEKVETSDGLEAGTYLIVYELTDSLGIAFNGGLETLDANKNGISVAISDKKIPADETTMAAVFTLEAMDGGYGVKSASGSYISQNSYNNGMVVGTTAVANTITIDNDGNAVIACAVGTDQTVTLRFNAQSGTERFRYYKSGQEPVALYKLVDNTPPEPEPNYIKVFFIDTVALQEEQTAHIFFWRAEGNVPGNGEYPGNDASPIEEYNGTAFVEKDGNRVYMVEINASEYDHVIFNHGGAGNIQTADLDFIADAEAKETNKDFVVYYLTDGGNNRYTATKQNDVWIQPAEMPEPACEDTNVTFPGLLTDDALEGVVKGLGHDFTVEPDHNDPEHYTAPTCTAEGLKYMKCSRCGAYDTEPTPIEKVPHTFDSAPAWTWAADYSTASAVFTCSVCQETHSEEAEIEITRTEPTPEAAGEIVYTATVTFEDHEYTDTQTESWQYLANGYYLLRGQGDDGWEYSNIKAADQFSPNGDTEYMLETTLAVPEEIKVVRVTNFAIDGWWPNAPGTQYHVDDAHAGNVTIYFKTDYVNDWSAFGGYFYIAVQQEPNILEGVKITNSLSLDAAITLNILIEKNSLDACELENVHIVFIQYKPGVENPVPETLTAKSAYYYSGGKYYYWFEKKNIPTCELNDLMVMHLEGEKDGETWVTADRTYNPLTFCYNTAKNTKKSDSLRTTCANLILFCEAAQNYWNYNNTARPARDDRWTEVVESMATLTDPTASLNNDTISTGAGDVEIVINTLELEGRVMLSYVIQIPDADDVEGYKLVCTYTDEKGRDKTVEIEGKDWRGFNRSSGQFKVALDTLNANDMRVLVTAEVKDSSGTVVSNTYKTSIESFAKKMLDNVEGREDYAALQPLMRAMMNYGLAAEAFLN